MSLFPFLSSWPELCPFFYVCVSFTTSLCCLSALCAWAFLSQFISGFPWMNYWFNQTTSGKMSSHIPLEFTQVHDFLQLSVLIWALWGPRDLLLIKQAQDMLCHGFGLLSSFCRSLLCLSSILSLSLLFCLILNKTEEWNPSFPVRQRNIPGKDQLGNECL